MSRLEQRCRWVQRVLDDYKVGYVKRFNNDTNLKITGTPFSLKITNRYISISYKKNKYLNYLPSFDGIN